MTSPPPPAPEIRGRLCVVWDHLSRRRIFEAGESLQPLSNSEPSVANACGVWHMANGENAKALDLLRPLALLPDEITPDPEADIAWRANFILALLKSGNGAGFHSHLGHLKDSTHPGIAVMRKLADEAGKSRGLFSRMFGSAPLPELPSDFPPGWAEDWVNGQPNDGMHSEASQSLFGDDGGLAGELVLFRQSRPVFVSSTFRDMHVERDFLRDHAFKVIEEKLAARGGVLEIIDLRQGVETAGIDTEEAREMRVLKVCLDEITRSRPYLVALIGGRYGHVPEPGRMIEAARLAGFPYPDRMAGKSITELEILFGVLENTEQAQRSWFFLRSVDPAGMPPEVSARFPQEQPGSEAAMKLAALKKRIRAEMPERVIEYTLTWDARTRSVVGYGDLDQKVQASIWSDLEKSTRVNPKASGTWDATDRLSMAAFMADRLRGFVERPALTGALVSFASSQDLPDGRTEWVLTGTPGSGKSSVFCKLCDELSRVEDREARVVLVHTVGAFAHSDQVDRMLARWTSELSVVVGEADPLTARVRPDPSSGGPSSPDVAGSEQLEATFWKLLARVAAEKPVVMLINALDRFENSPRARHLAWLPVRLPENVRLLATSVACDASEAIAARESGFVSVIPPLVEEEVCYIIHTLHTEVYHRMANPRAMDVLLHKNGPEGVPACHNPLWLVLALHEINLLSSDDFERAEREFGHVPPAERMESLLLDTAEKMPMDLDGVYGKLLDRAIRVCGKDWSTSFMRLLSLSRNGWRESDLASLMPRVGGDRELWDPLLFATMRRIMGRHFGQHGACAQWDFCHPALKNVARSRHVASREADAVIHRHVLEHLEALPTGDPVAETEMMFHIVAAEDSRRAVDYFTRLATMEWILSNRESRERMSALVSGLTSGDAGRREQILSWVISLMRLGRQERSLNVIAFVVLCLDTMLDEMQAGDLDQARERLLLATQECVLDLYNEELRKLESPEQFQAAYRTPEAEDRLREIHATMARMYTEYKAALSTIIQRRLTVIYRRHNLDQARAANLASYRYGNEFENASHGTPRPCMHASDLSFFDEMIEDLNSESIYLQPALMALMRDGELLLAMGSFVEAGRCFAAVPVGLERLGGSHQSFFDPTKVKVIAACRLLEGDSMLSQGRCEQVGKIYQIALDLLDEAMPKIIENENAPDSFQFQLPQGPMNLQNIMEMFSENDVFGDNRTKNMGWPTSSEWRYLINIARRRLGAGLLAAGNPQLGCDACESAVAELDNLLRIDPGRSSYSMAKALACLGFAECLMAMQRWRDSLPRIETAMTILWQHHARNPEDPWKRSAIAHGLDLAEKSLRMLGEVKRADEYHAKRLALAVTAPMVGGLDLMVEAGNLWSSDDSHYNFAVMAFIKPD